MITSKYQEDDTEECVAWSSAIFNSKCASSTKSLQKINEQSRSQPVLFVSTSPHYTFRNQQRFKHSYSSSPEIRYIHSYKQAMNDQYHLQFNNPNYNGDRSSSPCSSSGSTRSREQYSDERVEFVGKDIRNFVCKELDCGRKFKTKYDIS